MDELIKTVIEHIPDAALPVVICFIFTYYIQYKRKETKSERDADSLELHDKLQRHEFEIARLKDEHALYDTVLNDLRTEMSVLNKNIATLTVKVEMLVNAWDRSSNKFGK